MFKSTVTLKGVAGSTPSFSSRSLSPCFSSSYGLHKSAKLGFRSVLEITNKLLYSVGIHFHMLHLRHLNRRTFSMREAYIHRGDLSSVDSVKHKRISCRWNHYILGSQPHWSLPAPLLSLRSPSLKGTMSATN